MPSIPFTSTDMQSQDIATEAKSICPAVALDLSASLPADVSFRYN